MPNEVTGTGPTVEGRTVYVMPDPAGFAATMARALDAGPEASRVVICGDRIGKRAEVLAWIERRADWLLLRDPYVKRRDLDIEASTPGGRRVRVTSAEPWFGEGVTPADAAEAMRYVRSVCADWQTYPINRPADTGRRLLGAIWERQGHNFPACPPEVAELLTATSGQGRFEVFPAGDPGDGRVYPAIWSVDARFMYASCARTELPVGEPVDIDGEPSDPYASSWCRVKWTPADGLPIGLLPFNDEGKWRWPTFGGWEGWCSGAELSLARQHGYRVEVVRSIVWPTKSKAPLRAFAELIDRKREHVAGLPMSAGTVAASRNALRAILIGCIGSLHSTTVPGGDSSERMMNCRRRSATEAATSAGGGPSFVRPEWTTAIWALARYRLARAMLDQTSPVIGCTLDGFYVAGRPVLPEDRGRAGSFIVKGSTQWPDPIRHQRELYDMAKTITP